MVYLESCARRNVSIYYAEYCRRRSCSGLHCDSNTKCGTETYAAYWIFIQLPGISSKSLSRKWIASDVARNTSELTTQNGRKF